MQLPLFGIIKKMITEKRLNSWIRWKLEDIEFWRSLTKRHRRLEDDLLQTMLANFWKSGDGIVEDERSSYNIDYDKEQVAELYKLTWQKT